MAWVKLSSCGWAQTTSTSIRRDRTSSDVDEAGVQGPLDARPVVVGDREQGGVAGTPRLTGHERRTVVAQDPLQPAADALDGPPAALVAVIGGDGDPVDAPDLEGMGEQQQLGLGVDGGPLHVSGQPRAADLHLVGVRAAAPVADLEEAGAADEAPV